jgi:cell division protein FtsN
MEYQFTFSRTRLLLLLLMFLIAALLIFAGGIATGQHISVSQVAGLPPAKPGLKVPAVAVPGQAAILKAATSTAAPAKSPAPPPEAQAAAPAPVPVAAAPETAPAKAPEAAAVIPPAVAVAIAPNPADQPFVLQVGAFRETKGAKDLQADLLKKGYATTIYNMVDEDQRSWHMVRFGGYKDLPAASKAASDFTGKEGIQALVKRFDSL